MRDVILLSGGVDSALILARLVGSDNKVWSGDRIWAVTFDYQQPARSEIAAAEKLAEFYGVTWCASSFNVISSGEWGFSEWSDMNEPDQIVLKNRNAMFLSLASAYGETLHVGAIKNDQDLFKDCRREFFNKMEDVLEVNIQTPLIEMTKAEVVEEARAVSVPLDLCVSCYRGNACGRCLSCLEIAGA